VRGPSPPSCVSTLAAARPGTAAGTGTAWRGSVGARRAGGGRAVSAWCVSHQPVGPTGSAPAVSGAPGAGAAPESFDCRCYGGA